VLAHIRTDLCSATIAQRKWAGAAPAERVQSHAKLARMLTLWHSHYAAFTALR